MSTWILAKDIELQHALHDSLTKLPIRRLLEMEFARIHKQERFPLSLIFADLNSLKQLNDCQGHMIGDQALIMVANI